MHESWSLDSVLLLLAIVGNAENAEARLTRIHPNPPAIGDATVFGATGPYLKISGTYEGEIDPDDRRNALIADIQLAPRTGGKVQYMDRWRRRDVAARHLPKSSLPHEWIASHGQSVVQVTMPQMPPQYIVLAGDGVGLGAGICVRR